MGHNLTSIPVPSCWSRCQMLHPRRCFFRHPNFVLPSRSRGLHNSSTLRQELADPQTQHHSTTPRSDKSSTQDSSLLSSSTSSSYVNHTALLNAVEDKETPRWKKTPEALLAPVSTNRRPGASPFAVNSDPRVLDKAYQNLLGPYYEQAMPSEEVKWLAVTHRSFDQGRRGFNDRLSFLGKRIVNLQVSIAMLNLPSSSANLEAPDRYGRFPFVHPAFDGLDVLTAERRMSVLDKVNLAKLGSQYGLANVVRWTPKDPSHLFKSGQSTVVAQSIYAVIGAIALEKGGELANKVVRDRIVRPLGL